MIIKQSTARTIIVGPVLDSTGAAKTDEVVASIKVTKNGTVGAADGATMLTHDHAGKYKLAMAAGDTDTLGVLEISLNSGTNDMPVKAVNVVPANVYDSLVAGSDALDVSLIQWLGVAPLALSTQQVQAVVPVTQKVDVETIKTQAVTAAAGVTVGAYVGGTGAAALETTAQSILTDTAEIGAAGAGLTSIPDSAGVGTLLTRIPAALFSGITSLAQWLGLIAGKQIGNATARTEIRATGAGAGTFDETTDSGEALRDRGDAAWITATGFSTLDAAGVRTAVGLSAANLDTQLADIPTVVEFNARTIVAANYALEATLTTIKGATFSGVTDSLEAIRDRGDAAWITATGFSTLDAAGVRTAVGLAAANLDTQLGDIPTVAEFNARSLVSASYATAAICTEARLAELDAANLPADVAAVKVDTAATLLDTGTDGVVVAAASKTGYSLAAAGLDAVVIETGMNARQAMSVIASALAGILSGAATSTIVIKAAQEGTTTRITATCDADGNRSAVTLTLPS